MTSILRWSVTGTTVFNSESNWFSFTRAPASRQMRATQISAGVPRGFNRPTREQADLWWPNTSNRAPHLQNRSSTWRGKCSLTRSNVRNSSAVKVVSGLVGRLVLVVRPAELGGPWTKVANARLLQRGCREQQMREIANHESTLPPLDRRAAGRGSQGPKIRTTRAPPCLRLRA